MIKIGIKMASAVLGEKANSMIGADNAPSAPPKPDFETATVSTESTAINNAKKGASPSNDRSNNDTIFNPMSADSLVYARLLNQNHDSKMPHVLFQTNGETPKFHLFQALSKADRPVF